MSQGHPESTSWGRILGEVRKTFLEEDPLKTLWGHLLDVSQFHFTFVSKLNVILRGVFRTQTSI